MSTEEHAWNGNVMKATAGKQEPIKSRVGRGAGYAKSIEEKIR
jgi:hypothetical protein